MNKVVKVISGILWFFYASFLFHLLGLCQGQAPATVGEEEIPLSEMLFRKYAISLKRNRSMYVAEYSINNTTSI